MKPLLVILTTLFTALLALGQEEPRHHLAVEFDPAPFVLRGYSVSVKYSSPEHARWAYMGSVYRSNFPDGMMKQSNREAGFVDMKMRTSYAFFTEYFLKEDRKGFYAGPAVFLYRKSVGIQTEDARAEFTSIYPNVRVGYIWYPFKKAGLYLNPWLNVGSELGWDGANQLKGATFELNRFQYILALHIGYAIEYGRKSERSRSDENE